MVILLSVTTHKRNSLCNEWKKNGKKGDLVGVDPPMEVRQDTLSPIKDIKRDDIGKVAACCVRRMAG